MGMTPVPLSLMVMIGLIFFGLRQTIDLHKLAGSRCLHKHPLFSHVPVVTQTVRDVENGRPDLYVTRTVDDESADVVGAAANQAQPTNGAGLGAGGGGTRIVNGVIVRDPPPQEWPGPDQPFLLPRQVIVSR
eukprot:gnl/MRDRNA2_/MRDRNA2_177065_c0_seq1.p1 gnl/MRDRNA2_/MRDRNA2_177065_c0~~gnl/MRDRNA2_/MRDRNA2_177065_c0_seq1.p1  ORF type:complete len:132 (-),score=12.64 gnl/MRDRNA2_/MRDRNA2_177065_c0_seq1:45-440(-)